MEEYFDNDVPIVINNILSFLNCKFKFVSKEKLFNCIVNYYSNLDILEALKALLNALPNEIHAKYRRKLKYSEPLNLIYECLTNTQAKNLPLFVCKDLNNVPCLDNNSILKEKPVRSSLGKESSFQEENEMNDDQCRKEQKEMKNQILEMISMIKELKNGLEKLNQKHQNAKIEKVQKEKEKITLTPNKDKKKLNFESKQNSHQVGLSLLQKLIDEDYENSELNPVAEVCIYIYLYN